MLTQTPDMLMQSQELAEEAISALRLSLDTYADQVWAMGSDTPAMRPSSAWLRALHDEMLHIINTMAEIDAATY
jgi:hypothetical protein